MSGKNLVRKSGLKLFIVSCIFASILVFTELVYFILVSDHAPDHAPLHSYPTTDNNTSTGMIRVSLNMGRSATNSQGNVMELSGNFTLSGEWSISLKKTFGAVRAVYFTERMSCLPPS